MKKVLKVLRVITAIAAFAGAVAFVLERIDEVKRRKRKNAHKPRGIYERFLKRPLDCSLSTGALIVLSPILLVLTAVGAVEMGGNPFFTQLRPGRDGKIFKLIKFRSMNNKKDKNGNLLPDKERLTKYGKWIRSTSLDELPELFNIVKGDMAIIGPRPLAVEYLPYYNEQERHRHDVRAGLTGLAQVNGRNALQWEDRFRYDVEYVENITPAMDLKILFKTVEKVWKKEDVVICGQGITMDFDAYRRQQMQEACES